MEALRRLKTVLAPILLRRTKVKPEKRRPVAKNIWRTIYRCPAPPTR